MAAVRCLARRLGGALLQRTQAAVAEEGRLLVPSRLMRSRQLSSKASGQHASEHSTRQVQQKEVELHDALPKLNEKHLSAQANEKKPFDPMRFKKYTERARGVLNLACKATFFVYASAFLFGITGADRMLGFPRKVREDKDVGVNSGS